MYLNLYFSIQVSDFGTPWYRKRVYTSRCQTAIVG